MPDTHTLIHSLNSDICPACQGGKLGARTLCGKCYHALPQSHKKALYKKVGAGYEAAFKAAMLQLGVDNPRMPESGPR